MPVFLADDDPALDASDDLDVALAFVAGAEIDAAAEPHRATIEAFVRAHPDVLNRSCLTGHLTGSAMVLSAGGDRVVWLHHTKLKRWLQPGGHCDGEANLAAVALREAREETGMRGLRIHPVAIDVDVHEVDPPKEGPHLHLDVRFLVVAPPMAQLRKNEESTELVWAEVDDIDHFDLDAGTLRMLVQGRRRLRAVRAP